MRAVPRVLPGQLVLEGDDGLVPIGSECGLLLIRLLELNGWRIRELTGFAGETLLIAHHDRSPIPVEVQAETLAAAASLLVERCNTYVRPLAA